MNKMKTLMLAALLTLSSGLAVAAPQPGVYQQMYADGKIKSTITILHNPGVSDFMAMNALGDSTYICMDALDKNGIELEEYAVKYNEDNTTTYGVSINYANLRQFEQNKWFAVNANKKSNLNLSFPKENKMIVSGAGALYDGEYSFSPRSAVQANSALMVYAYENTRKPSIAYEGTGIANGYHIVAKPNMPWLATMRIKNDTQEEKEVILDNGFNIVMECDNTDVSSYKPFFVSHKYVEWSEQGLKDLQADVDGNFSSLYMHAYMAKAYPALTKANNIILQSKDFFGGEGPNAVFTRQYFVKKYNDGEEMLSGLASHTDNGRMLVQQFIGNKTITGDEVRVRDQANTNGAILGYVNKGDVVNVVGVKYGLPWALVKLSNGTCGYVSTQFIQGLSDVN